MTSSGQAWTLIARFSNNDAKNWMEDSAEWWYDKSVGLGEIADSSVNADMLSPSFWLVRGREFKITRSDDTQHTALLQTTGECLGGQTFRAKITSYGDFRNGRVWASDDCQGNCNVQYGGQFQTTDGFRQATCNGSLQSATLVGFWCAIWKRLVMNGNLRLVKLISATIYWLTIDIWIETLPIDYSVFDIAFQII